MVVHANNPVFEIINSLIALYVIALTTTRNAIALNVSNFIVNPVNPIEHIRSICPSLFMNLIRLYSAVMARLLGNPSKKLSTKIPFKPPVLSIVSNLTVELPESRLPSRKFEGTPTAFCVSPSERTSINYLLASTCTHTKKHSMSSDVVVSPTQNSPLSYYLSSQVNKFHRVFFPSCLLRCTTLPLVHAMFARGLSI